MKLTVYNPQNREQKFTIRYRPSYDQVIEGKFTMMDESGKELSLTEDRLYQEMRQVFLKQIAIELTDGPLKEAIQKLA